MIARAGGGGGRPLGMRWRGGQASAVEALKPDSRIFLVFRFSPHTASRDDWRIPLEGIVEIQTKAFALILRLMMSSSEFLSYFCVISKPLELHALLT